MTAPLLILVTSPDHIETAKALFREYQRAIKIDLCFQSFDNEVATLPGEYAPPSGRLYLCVLGESIAGCVALRRIDERTCEMKRLYVRPAFRGHHLGRILASKLIEDAQSIGYRSIRLDTLPFMTEAIALYKSLGFSQIEPYRDNPHPGALYMELVLPHRTH
jgi:ribosomal protein S18 acetylase RimI-like enzyme